MLPMYTSMGRVWVTRGCIIPPRHAKGILPSYKFRPKRFRAAYVPSRGCCIFVNRDSVGILTAKRCWTLGTSASRLYQAINASKYGLRSVFWQNKEHRQIPLGWKRLSAGSSTEENTRSATPQALARSCVDASKKSAHHQEARYLAKPLQQEWR